MTLSRTALSAALVLASAACQGTTEPLERLVKFEIAESLATCSDWTDAIRTCMVVREPPRDTARLMYEGSIEGFTFEPGYSYELMVAIVRVRNPPADGSSERYVLVRQLRKDRVPPA